SLAITSNGTVLKNDLWTHAQMPAVTVEAAYLTNPREAALLTRTSTLDAIAGAVDSGVLAQAPEIATRKAQILSYEKAHASAPAVVAVKAASRFPIVPAGALALLVVAFFYRRRVAPVVLPVLALAIAAVAV